jgi:hypothetical protein
MRDPQMMRAIGNAGTVPAPQNSVATSCTSPSGQRQRVSSSSTSAQGRMYEREGFNHLEICVADAVGQRLTSKKASSVVQRIIREPRSLAL